MNNSNKNPEQIARDKIDKQLKASGWKVQDRNKVDFNKGLGIAIREYPTDVGPSDYVLFVDREPVGIIEAKRKKKGQNITTVEEQSGDYAKAKLKHIDNRPLPFVYESTGIITRFRDERDPKPRSREVFNFHRPETLQAWFSEADTLRARLQNMPELNVEGLRDCQINAVTKLESSFSQNRPRALIQMATGSGKTFTAITAVYRLLKFVGAKRILFLVDTKNLGKQAEQEFMAYVPNDTNRKFTELYNVQRLRSSYMADSSQVCISTIQRVYSILKDEPLEDAAEQENPAERVQPKKPLPVVYNEKVPFEYFDFVIIDECHRSIYNLWRQVLEYFDAYLIGLTATPDKRTYGFFKENIVSEYTHEEAVADRVNVGYDVYTIETKITKQGEVLRAEQQIEKRDRTTRKKRWAQQDEDEAYTSKQLDRDIVNPNQIRKVINTFRKQLPEIFPGRDEVPKTLIFAKTDSHADDIINIVREEFDEGNQFCKKVTYKADEDSDSVLAQFRNAYNPRIAVTVDMIATGTDVKPLECLLFMRDVKSRNYFEQMKGRGTRTYDYDKLKKVTPSAESAKTHFVIVDAIGVTKSLKTDSRPLERHPSVPLKDLLYAVMVGAKDEDTISSLASRLSRLNNQINEDEQKRITAQSGGVSLAKITHDLMDAIDANLIEAMARDANATPDDDEPTEAQLDAAQEALAKRATVVLTGELCNLIEGIRRSHEQVIDTENLDELIKAGWEGDVQENAKRLTEDFAACLKANKDQITALSIYFDEPYRRREVTYSMASEVLERLKVDQPRLSPLRVWEAYALLDEVTGKSPHSELTALVGLIRRVCNIDEQIRPYDETVRRNFQSWVLKRHSGKSQKFTEEQMEWLRMIRDHIATSFHVTREDLDLAPFDNKGGLGRMWKLFGDDMDSLVEELNEELAA